MGHIGLNQGVSKTVFLNEVPGEKLLACLF